jgi:FHA domain
MAEHRDSQGELMPEINGTKSDPAAQEWAINDRVVQIRVWGTDIVHRLPDPPPDPGSDAEEVVLGASATCSIRVDDPTGLASRVHARISSSERGWVVRDLDSKNGIQFDGAQRPKGLLEPGVELGIGGVVFIAESAKLIALRGFLARLLGWGPERRHDVDRALRSVRLGATRRAPLVLSAQGDLVPIALSLHAHGRGRDKPFILCDPRRVQSGAGVRSVANYKDVRDGLRAAIGGSLCLLRRRMPGDVAVLFNEIRSSRPRVQWIVCTTAEEHGDVMEALLADSIVVPPIARRAKELDRIIHEYAVDAMTDLGVDQSTFTDQDHEWVRTSSASSFTDIEKGTRRIIARRTGQSNAGAAERLGMAGVSLTNWLKRREFSPGGGGAKG